MEKIELRNLKRESLIISAIVFILGVVIFSWAMQGGFELRIYGAWLDADTSQIMLFIIALFPIIYGVMRLSDYYFLNKMEEEFVITIGPDIISYPAPAGRFKGFQIVEIHKDHILYVKAFNPGENKYEIQLRNHDHDVMAAIPYHELCDARNISEKELEKKINDWLDNYDIIDPDLFL